MFQKIAVQIYMKRTFNFVMGIFVNRVTEKFCNFVAFHMDEGRFGGSVTSDFAFHITSPHFYSECYKVLLSYIQTFVMKSLILSYIENSTL